MTSKPDESKYDETAKVLALYCADQYRITGKNSCFSNVTENINTIITYFSRIDLLGIQEATGFVMDAEAWLTKKQLDNNLLFIHHQIQLKSGKYAEMISFYNSNTFILDAVITGDIVNNENISNGRPYQLLFLTKKNTGKKYIFINIHNGHGRSWNKENLERNLSKNMNVFIPPSIQSYIRVVPEVCTTDYRNVLAVNNYNIIFLGDTNDHGRLNLWNNDFIPLKYTGIPSINTIQVTAKGEQPPNTCCTGEHSLRSKSDDDPWYGDYILINDRLNYTMNNTIPLFNYNAQDVPSSDHLPIVAVINDNEPLQEYRIQTEGINVYLRVENSLDDPPHTAESLVRNGDIVIPSLMGIGEGENQLIYVTFTNNNKKGFIKNKYLRAVNVGGRKKNNKKKSKKYNKKYYKKSKRNKKSKRI